MESIGPLLDRARQAGLLVLHEGDRLIVRGPKRLGDLAAQLLDQKATVVAALQAETAPMVKAEADPAVAMIADIFGPGVQVVRSGPAGPWPPEGGWLPSSARTIDVYGAEMPAAPCPCCGATAWRRAGDGWTCETCHPAPGVARGPATMATTMMRRRRSRGCRRERRAARAGVRRERDPEPVAEVQPAVAAQLRQLSGWLGTLDIGVMLVVKKTEQLTMRRVTALAADPGRQP